MTISNIDTDFDGWTDGAGGGGSSVTVQELQESTTPPGADARRPYYRFPLGVITAGSTISNVSFQVKKTGDNVESGDSLTIHAYAGTGDTDPSGDSSADQFTNAAAGSALATDTTAFITSAGTASATVDLGATADSQVQGNISSPGFYAVGFNAIFNAGSELVQVEALENAGTDPATLIVDWTAPSGHTVTVAATLDELTAALNVSQGQPVTLAPILDELLASLAVSHGQQLTVVSTLSEVSTSLSISVVAAAAFILSPSSFITASGENTTAQLTAPAGKTTADFGGGRIQDDENPGDAVDLGADEYREDEWCIQATELAEVGEQYEFRVVLSDGTPLDSYTLTPKWTIGAAATTVTLQAILDELTAALSVSHGQQLTIVSTLDEVMASLNVQHGQAVTLQSTLDEVQASLSVSHGQQLTIVSTLDEVAASLNVNVVPPPATVTIQTTLDEVAASLNISHGQQLTIATTLDEVMASLNVGQAQLVTVQSTLDEVTAALNVSHGQRITIVSTLDEVQASLNIQQPFTLQIASTLDEVLASLNVSAVPAGATVNIASTLDKVFANLNVSHGQQLTIASTLDEVFASLNISHGQTVTIATVLRELKASLNVFSGYQLTIASTLDEVFASLNIGQAHLMTLSPVLRELLASLQISHGQRITIASSLDEVQASLNLGQIQEMLIAVLLDELTAALSIEVGAHIPVAGTFIMAFRERDLRQRARDFGQMANLGVREVPHLRPRNPSVTAFTDRGSRRPLILRAPWGGGFSDGFSAGFDV